MSGHRTRLNLTAWLCGLALLLPILSVHAELPAKPTTQKTFTFDYANIIGPEAKETIHEAQVVAFNQYDTPIVVVTINRMSQYNDAGSIEVFAKYWFNFWQIGKAGSNKGVLFLISLEDRKARIELGADWGRDWDQYCQYVMDQKIVPRFKQGNYDGGILAGIQGISSMAAKGPDAAPPGKPMMEKFFESPIVSTLNHGNPIPTRVSVWILGLGMLLVIIGIVQPNHRKLFILSGLLLIGMVVVFWVMVGVAVLLLPKGDGDGDSSWGGGSFSGGGGGFSGGFSGGGGASGSW